MKWYYLYIVPIFILVIWSLVSGFELVSPILLPTPWKVVSALFEILFDKDKNILFDIGLTCYRTLSAFAISSIIGVPLGLLMGYNLKVFRAFEFTVDFCRENIFNGKPLIKSQVTQFALVEMTTEIKLGRTFMEKLCAEHMENNNVVVETSMAKYWTTDMVNRIAERSMDICGESATLESNILARAKRDVRVMSIFAGTNEIMKGIAAKFMGM